MQTAGNAHHLRDGTPGSGPGRGFTGDVAIGSRFPQPRGGPVAGKIPQGAGGRAQREPHAHPEANREPHPGTERGGIPDRITAWGWLTPGTAHPDPTPDGPGAQATPGQAVSWDRKGIR